jgi:hypothetical protein
VKLTRERLEEWKKNLIVPVWVGIWLLLCGIVYWEGQKAKPLTPPEPIPSQTYVAQEARGVPESRTAQEARKVPEARKAQEPSVIWDRELWATRANWWASRPHCICRSVESLVGLKHMCTDDLAQDMKCEAKHDR